MYKNILGYKQYFNLQGIAYRNEIFILYKKYFLYEDEVS